MVTLALRRQTFSVIHQLPLSVRTTSLGDRVEQVRAHGSFRPHTTLLSFVVVPMEPAHYRPSERTLALVGRLATSDYRGGVEGGGATSNHGAWP